MTYLNHPILLSHVLFPIESCSLHGLVAHLLSGPHQLTKEVSLTQILVVDEIPGQEAGLCTCLLTHQNFLLPEKPIYRQQQFCPRGILSRENHERTLGFEPKL